MKYHEKIQLFHKQIQHHEEVYETKKEVAPKPEPVAEPEPPSVPDLKIEFNSNNQPLDTVLEESDAEHELDLSENTIIELKTDDFNL